MSLPQSNEEIREILAKKYSAEELKCFPSEGCRRVSLAVIPYIVILDCPLGTPRQFAQLIRCRNSLPRRRVSVSPNTPTDSVEQPAEAGVVEELSKTEPAVGAADEETDVSFEDMPIQQKLDSTADLIDRLNEEQLSRQAISTVVEPNLDPKEKEVRLGSSSYRYYLD